MERTAFSQRLAALREQKNVSARDMSLSLGQSASYINNIENGKAFPSMQCFFNICEYLNITPGEFFDTGTQNPEHLNQLIRSLKRLDAAQLDVISAMVNSLLKNR